MRIQGYREIFKMQNIQNTFIEDVYNCDYNALIRKKTLTTHLAPIFLLFECFQYSAPFTVNSLKKNGYEARWVKI